MALVNCQEARSMKLLNPFLILIQFFFIILIFRSEVGAVDTPPCVTYYFILWKLRLEQSKIEAAFGEYSINTILRSTTLR